jgi:sugar O-acyltransferase (sialic acid O-acetyltransferase NeuD family)
MSITVTIPLINANEPEAMIAEIFVLEGQQVEKNELLCTLETTKSTAEVYAEAAGYVRGLRFKPGDTAGSGDIFCYLAPEPGGIPLLEEPTLSGSGESKQEIPENMRITEPALVLARRHSLDLKTLPYDILITERFVQEHLAHLAGAAPPPKFSKPLAPFDTAAVLIYGGGGHAKMVIDLLRALRTYRLTGIIDDGRRPGEMVSGVPILGGAEKLSLEANQGVRLAVNAVGGIGNIGVRVKIFHRLAEAGFVCPALAHPTAYLDSSARLAGGAQIFVHAYVGPDAHIGYGCIINTGAIISHDCQLGNYVNISPGAILAGEVKAGNGALVGMGATINLGVSIGAGARIGNGATIKKDVPDGTVVRAGATWPA